MPALELHMFGKKKNVTTIDAAEEVAVQAMPADFYGGANPEIKFRTTQKIVEKKGEPAPRLPSKEPAQAAKPAPGAARLKPAALFSSRKFLGFSLAVVFVLFVAGASGYYWYQATKSQTSAPSVAPNTTPAPTPASVPVPESAAVTTTPPASALPTTTTEAATGTAPGTAALGESPLETPSLLLGDSADSDRDGLTNAEEELFGTDPEVPDTDTDGFSDSVEIYNLYSPRDKAPTKLIDSAFALVKDFANPMFGYHIYYPSSWALGNLDPSYRDMLFSTITGENVEVRVFDKTPGQTFVDWFTKQAPGERYADLVNFVTVFKVPGKSRSDRLVFYFEDQNHFYAIVYHTTDSAIVNYRSVITMMARSFRLSNTEAVIPVEVIEGATTTAGAAPPPSTAGTTTAPGGAGAGATSSRL